MYARAASASAMVTRSASIGELMPKSSTDEVQWSETSGQLTWNAPVASHPGCVSSADGHHGPDRGVVAHTAADHGVVYPLSPELILKQMILSSGSPVQSKLATRPANRIVASSVNR